MSDLHTDVAMGVVPQGSRLAGVPTFSAANTEPAAATTDSTASSGASQRAGNSATLAGASAGILSWLLPQGGTGPASRLPKVWVGDGLPAIPKKLHERMTKWEFVELAEIRPAGSLDAVNPEPDPQQYIITRDLEISRARRKPIKDISTWVQCFAIYVAAMAKQHAELVPEMLAYMLAVMRAQKEFEEPAWRLYDIAFREKAASTGNRRWSQLDPVLYNQIFTGRARRVAICTHCNATNHTSEECAEAPPRKRAAMSHEPSGGRRAEGEAGVCWQFNQGHCEYHPSCRFQHVCSACKRKHPLVRCPRVPRAGGQAWFPSRRPMAGRGAMPQGPAT